MKRNFALSIFSAIALSLAVAGCGTGFEISKGNRVGNVQKISKKGLIYPTWEGELVLDGIKSSATSSLTNVWAFSADDDKIGEKLVTAMDAGVKVRVTYTENRFHGVAFGDTRYRIVDVHQMGQ